MQKPTEEQQEDNPSFYSIDKKQDTIGNIFNEHQPDIKIIQNGIQKEQSEEQQLKTLEHDTEEESSLDYSQKQQQIHDIPSKIDIELQSYNTNPALINLSNSISQNNKAQNQMTQSQIKEDNKQKSTVFQASVNLFKSYIGAGILGLPLAFSQAGYILASICMMSICAMMLYTSNLIFEIQNALGRQNMGFKEIFIQTMGKKACFMYQFFLVFAQMGCCVSYVIFFTEFFQIAFKTTDDPSSRLYYLCFSLIIIVPLTMINNFHFFVKWSKIANVLTILVLFGIVEFAIETIIDKPSYENEHNLGHFMNLAGFLGIAIYSFEAIGTMFYVKNSMQKPEEFPRIFCIVSIIVACICVLFSTLCTLAWGNKLKSIVLLGLEKERSYFLLLSALYAVNMIFSYPVQFYPIIDALNKINTKYEIRPKFRYVPRWMATGFIFFLAFIIPKFGIMLNLVGAFAGVALQFFFPIMAYQSYFRTTISRRKKTLNYGILSIAILCGLFSVQHSIRELAE